VESSVPQARSVALIVGNSDSLRAPDIALRNRLIEQGHTLEIHGSGQVTIAATSSSDVLVVSGTVRVSDIDDLFALDARPILVSEHALFDDFGLVAGPSNQGTQSATPELALVDDSLGIGAGQAGEQVTVVTRGRSMNWGIPGGNALVLATLVNDASRATIFAYEQGSQLPNGELSAGRRLAWHEAGFSANVWSPDGETFFDQAINWLLQP